jgi:formylglycine-generating enzyme required for sulfatase activity
MHQKAIFLALLFMTSGAHSESITHGSTTINMDFVDIGYAGNTSDTRDGDIVAPGIQRYGKVDYNYRIGRCEVTIDQFSRAFAADSRISNGNENYWNDGLRTVGTDAPASQINWFEAAKFANYLTTGDAYNGAYQFDGGGTLIAVDRNAAVLAYGTVYVLPTEDEWYKAAYYKTDGSGYSLYANGLTTTPARGGSNGWNYYNGSYVNSSPNYTWVIGFGAQEQNGTYNMMGNVWEWNESASDGNLDNMNEKRVLRGGSYGDFDYSMSSSHRNGSGTTDENSGLVGFRVAVIQVLTQPWPQLGADIEGESNSDYSGYSVSINSDGTRVAIGAPLNDGNGNESGHVRIYEYSGDSWMQLGSDIDGKVAGDASGRDVSLSADGNRVAIGSVFNDDNGIDVGLVRIYQYAAGSWNKLGQDLYGDAPYSDFGDEDSVSISADGNRVAVGARNNNNGGDNSGHVRIYEYSGGTWNQLGAEIIGEVAGEQSGRSVSLSEDGSRIAIGSPQSYAYGGPVGQVRVFEYSGGIWNQLGADISGEAVPDNSGYTVSLSADGTRVAIGAPYNADNGDAAGQIRVYEYASGIWQQLGSDIDGAAAGDQFGRAIALSADGKRLAGGADQTGASGDGSGQVRIFAYKGTNWVQIGEAVSGDDSGEQLGYSVSLNMNGSRIAIGSPHAYGFKGGTKILQVGAILNISVVGNGTVTPTNGVYDLGTNITLSATADTDWLFVGWSGDITGDYTITETNLFFDTSKYITATFSDDADGDGLLNANEYALGTNPRSSDTDGDQLSDYDEVYIYPTSPTNRDGDADGLSDGAEILTYHSDPELYDTDGDGFGDGFEVSTGFDPTLTNSTPDTLSRILTAVEFQFNAATGVSYRVEATANLSNTWEAVETNIIGEGGVVSRLYSTEGQPKRFFRAVRE